MGIFDGIDNFLQQLPPIVNTVGQKKELYCLKCKTMREHVSVSWIEKTTAHQEVEGENPLIDGIEHLAGKINDLNPITTLFVGRPFRCPSCGNIKVT